MKKILTYGKRALLLLLALLMVSVVAGFLWIATGTRYLTYFTQYAENFISSSPLIEDASVGDIRLSWSGWLLSPTLYFTDIEFYGADTTLLARAASTSIQLNRIPFLQREFEPTAVDIDSLDLYLEPFIDALDLEPTADSTDWRRDVFTALADAPEIVQRYPTLEITRVTNVRAFGGPLTDSGSVSAPEIVIALEDDGKLTLALDAVYRRGRLIPHVEIQATVTPVDSLIHISAAFEDLTSVALADALPDAEPLRGLPCSLSGAASVTGTFAGEIREGDVHIKSDGGMAYFPKLFRDSLHVRGFRAYAALIGDAQGLALRSSRVDIENLSIEITGELPDFASLPTLNVRLVSDSMDIRRIDRYWPLAIAEGAKEWILEHVSEGDVTGLEAAVRIEPRHLRTGEFPVESLSARIDFEHMDVDYLAPLPQAHDASGFAQFTAHLVEINVDDGALEQSFIDSVKVTIVDIREADSDVKIGASIYGPAADIQKAIRLANPELLDSAVTITGGAAATHFAFGFSLDRSYGFRDLGFTAFAELYDIDVPNFYLDLEISAAAGALTFDNGKIRVIGETRANGVDATFDWSEDFFDDDPARHIALKGALTPDDIVALGGIAMPFLDGAANVEAFVVVNEFHSEITAQCDVADVGFAFDDYGLRKARGARGTLNFDAIATTEKEVRVSRFELRTDSIFAAGSVSGVLGDVSTLRSVVEPLQYGSNNATLNIGYEQEIGYTINIEADTLDARRLYASMFEADDEAEEGWFNGVIRANAKRAMITDSLELYKATFESGWNISDCSYASLVGRLPQRKRLFLRLAPFEGYNRLTLTSTDAGAVLRGLDVYPYIRGGEMQFTIDLDSLYDRSQPMRGSLHIEQYKLIEAPILTRILNLASLTGIPDLLLGKGVDFRELDVDVKVHRDTVFMSNGRMNGISLGVSGEGLYDRSSQTVTIEGTVVPFNLVNDIISTIPILGDLIVGEGIIATDYSIRGPHKDPDVSVNPISTLAVGFLRDIFKLF